MNRTSARRFAGLILPVAVLVAAPAHAATVNVTGDSGAPVPLQNGMTVRHMAPDVTLAFAAEETHYAVRVVGPTGPAAIGTDCLSSSSASAERVRYQGNGAYTVFFKSGKDRASCQSATEQSAAFTINASTAVVPPDKQPLLRREFGSFSSIPFEVPVTPNPGADSYEMRYALNGTVGPDGGLTGTSDVGFVDRSTGRARVTFSKPGRYTFVVRAKTVRSDTPTAWSAPVQVRVVDPFDLSFATLSDNRGPTYVVKGTVRETSATGKVTIAIGKGKKAKRFKRLGTAKIRRGGKFKLRFRMRKFGNYTIRFSYKGNATVARGAELRPIRFYRTFG